MKEAFIDKSLTVTVHETDLPVPAPGQLLIRVVAAGLNPKDWKLPSWFLEGPPSNQGDDIAGYVEAVGDGVVGFKRGDKVAALHQMFTPHGGWAEYALACEYTTFHLPERTSFEEAATMPMAAMTAALGLYQRLRLPLPWNPTDEALPLVIYGGSTAVGAFAIKLATLSNIHPLIVVAGQGTPFVETLLDRTKGDTVINYRGQSEKSLQSRINAATQGLPIHHAYDAVAEGGSSTCTLGAALTAPGTIAAVWPPKEGEVVPPGIRIDNLMVGSLHTDPVAQGNTVQDDREFAAVFARFLGRALAQRSLSGHPFEVRAGGLRAIEGGLKDLQAGKASAVKYVVRIEETD